jgi:hypothetical protein
MINLYKFNINLRWYFFITVLGVVCIFLFTYSKYSSYYESKVYLLSGKYYLESLKDSAQLEIPEDCNDESNSKLQIENRYEDRSNNDIDQIIKLSLIWNIDSKKILSLEKIVECIISEHKSIINTNNQRGLSVYFDNIEANTDQFTNHHKFNMLIDYQPTAPILRTLNNRETKQLGRIVHEMFDKFRVLQFAFTACINFLLVFTIIVLILNQKHPKE